jgi:hypothetical protein
MTLPVSPFLQFADTCKASAELWESPRSAGLAPPLSRLQLAEKERTAERHARLLAQIEQWANSPFDDRHHALSPANAGNAAKAHLRSLLEQP